MRNAPLEVDLQHAVEIGFGQLEEVGGMDDAGVVDRDVDIAERAAGFGNGVGSACRVADIGGEETGIAQRPRGGLAGGGVDVGNGDFRPFGHVVPGDREPDAVRGAGHDRHLVLEPHGGPLLQSQPSFFTSI